MARGLLPRMVAISSAISMLLVSAGAAHAISNLLGLDQNPALPVTLDTTPVAPTGKTISVGAGQDLQAALDSAQPGDVVAIAAPVPPSPATSSCPRKPATAGSRYGRPPPTRISPRRVRR